MSVMASQITGCLFDRLFRLTSKKIQKPVLQAFYEGNPPVNGGFPSQRACDTESVSASWRHHGLNCDCGVYIKCIRNFRVTLYVRLLNNICPREIDSSQPWGFLLINGLVLSHRWPSMGQSRKPCCLHAMPKIDSAGIQQATGLTHLTLAPQICVSESGQHCLR